MGPLAEAHNSPALRNPTQTKQMKTPSLKSLALALVAGTALTAAIVPAQAQNTAHGPASLILTFQNPGGTTGSDQTITVAINDASFFRDAELGSFFDISVSGLGASLSSTFGATWYEQPTLWMGVAGVRGSGSITGNTTLTGDPQMTQYFSRRRDSIGTAGVANSSQPVINLNAQTGITSGINQVKGTLEQNGQSPILVRPTSTSFIDENLPFTAPGVQNAAYTQIGGGVQGNFGEGSFGSLGGAGATELALDLYRVQYRNNIAGQSGFGEPTNTGKFLGTITINQSGGLGYVTAVPEPSTIAMAIAFVAGVAGTAIARRRRNAKA